MPGSELLSILTLLSVYLLQVPEGHYSLVLSGGG